MIGATKLIRRCLMGVLRPLTGDRATGYVTAKASAGQGIITLEANSWCIPVVQSAGTGKGQIARDLPFRTTADVVINEAGTLVPIASLLGGARHNLVNGTTVRWDPPLLGVTSTATITGALSNGADATTSPGYVKRILAFEEFKSAQAVQDAFLARVGHTPTIVVAWAGSGAAGSLGTDACAREDSWRVYVIVSSSAVDGGLDEIDQVLDILDAVEGYLQGRSSFEHIIFSNPPLEIRSRGHVKTTPTSRIYQVSCTTTVGISRTEHRSIANGDFAEWLSTQIDLQTATPLPLPVVGGAIYPMNVQFTGEFTDEFGTPMTEGEEDDG